MIGGIALVVHDFKSPLAGIMAEAQWLATRQDLPPDVLGAVQDIVEGARSLDRLILNLLDVCRSEDGALVPKPCDLDVGALLHEVATGMSRRAARQGQQLIVETELEGRSVRADPDLLRRVLENLLDNAVKYSPWKGTIRIAARWAGGALDVSVADVGEGIPQEFREAIFESYVRLERSALAGVGSSRGLGLAFCRAAVEAHGGRIWVEDNSPKGSVFRLRLPFEPSSRDATGAGCRL